MRTILTFLTIATFALSGHANAELVFGGNSLISRGPGTYSFTYSVTATEDTQIVGFNLPFDLTDGVTFSEYNANAVFGQSSSSALSAPFVSDVGLAGGVGTLAIGAGQTEELFTVDLTIGFDPVVSIGSDQVLAAPVTTGFDSNFLLVETATGSLPLSELSFTQGFAVTAIPEPSSLVVLGAASCLCVIRRRRRTP